MYARPQNLEEMVDHSLGRVLDLFGIDTGRMLRWGETAKRRPLAKRK
jgi:4-hydroxy-3-polyprenylbenzoate decarboxylase